MKTKEDVIKYLEAAYEIAKENVDNKELNEDMHYYHLGKYTAFEKALKLLKNMED